MGIQQAHLHAPSPGESCKEQGKAPCRSLRSPRNLAAREELLTAPLKSPTSCPLRPASSEQQSQPCVQPSGQLLLHPSPLVRHLGNPTEQCPRRWGGGRQGANGALLSAWTPPSLGEGKDSCMCGWVGVGGQGSLPALPP